MHTGRYIVVIYRLLCVDTPESEDEIIYSVLEFSFYNTKCFDNLMLLLFQYFPEHPQKIRMSYE